MVEELLFYHRNLWIIFLLSVQLHFTIGDPNIFVMVEGTYGSESSSSILAEINRLRKEACDKGYPDPRTDGETNLKPSDYVPIKWSTNLEKNAKLRASEATIFMAHFRPNTKHIYTVDYGTEMSAENFAWGYGGCVGSIKGWASEKSDWIAHNQNAVTGHYTSMINPDHKCVGVASFSRSYFGYGDATAAHFSSDEPTSQAQDKLDGKVAQLIEVAMTSYEIEGTEASKVIGVDDNSMLMSYASVYGYDGYYVGEFPVYEGIEWTSSDTNVATIDSHGMIHGVSPGKTDIRGFIGSDEYTVYEVSGEILVASVNRLYGSSRYDTSIAAADKLKETLGVNKFSSIIVATGDNYPDALTGAYLSKVKNAPIILVNSASESRIVDYIKDNLASDGKVFILGGTGVVSEGFERTVKSRGYSVSRLAGSTRYETNIAILKEAGVKNDDLLICTGGGFADSLSASAVGKPILLVDKSGISAKQKAYLDSISIKDIYLIGGTGVVSDAVGNSLAKYDQNKKCDRVAGANRYSTSTAIADKFFGRNITRAVFAYAQNFPDGLSGGPLAIAQNIPLLLTDTVGCDITYQYTSKTKLAEAYVLGGPSLIPDGIVEYLTNQRPD